MKENIKVIFLDIDGVLNSYDWILECYKKNNGPIPIRFPTDDNDIHYNKYIDYKAVKILSKIINKSKAKIVLSSSWRIKSKNDQHMLLLKETLEKNGMSIFDNTERSLKRKPRGWEIRQWLKDNKHKYNIVSFVIIDDDSYDIINHKKTLLPYYVKTSFKDGLQERHISKALHVLNGGKLSLTLIEKKNDPEWKTDKQWFRKYIQEEIEK